MQNELDNVRLFLKATGAQLPPAFRYVRQADMDLVKSLIREEHNEYEQAQAMTVAHLDALIDLAYVTMNGLCYAGLETGLHKLPVTRKHPNKISLMQQAALCQHRCVQRPLCENEIFKQFNTLLRQIEFACDTHYYPFATAFDIVHKANMTKFWPLASLKEIPKEYSHRETLYGYIVKRPDGKVIKPPTFRPPDLLPLVNAARRSFGLPAISETAPA